MPKKNRNKYSGIIRCLNYLSGENKNNILTKLGLSEDDFEFDSSLKLVDKIENLMKDICEELYHFDIILSQHHDGFEGDFIQYLKLNGNDVDEELINFLKKAKLKNLHNFINEVECNLQISQYARKSILVRFLYE